LRLHLRHPLELNAYLSFDRFYVFGQVSTTLRVRYRGRLRFPYGQAVRVI
jgi:hypothetical protein